MDRIDLNCDLGEGAVHDAELMESITSANIACGGHAGDEATMRATAELALEHAVAIGAHPGFDDRANFGRRELPVSPSRVRELVLAQVHVLQGIVRSLGARLRHVKPHGALYTQAARDAVLAEAVADAVYEVDSRLVLYGPSGSRLIAAGRAAGLRVAQEVFADRTYQADGSITPRSRAGAFIEDENTAAQQVLRIVREGRVRTVDGVDIALVANTVCVHGDGPHPVEFARRLKQELRKVGLTLAAFGP